MDAPRGRCETARMDAAADLPLSPRIRAASAPPIPTARAWAARYDGAAGPLLDLTQAVPGYPPHPDLLARLAAVAGDRACAGYGPIDGEPALRAALAADIARAYAARSWPTTWPSPPAATSPSPWP
jgi:aspartate/methionine/tyrosine aminotransferase